MATRFMLPYASALLDCFGLSERLEFAAWCAARTVLALGGRSNLPTREWIRAADRSSRTYSSSQQAVLAAGAFAAGSRA